MDGMEERLTGEDDALGHHEETGYEIRDVETLGCHHQLAVPSDVGVGAGSPPCSAWLPG